ncbi:MAG: hypothetical protein AAFY60_05100, partial [Myxococcota bacterium]
MTPWLFVFVIFLLFPGGLEAQECSEISAPLSPIQLLRRASLDLRGHVPTADELDELHGLDAADVQEASETRIDEFVRSDGFREVMQRAHRELLWPNLSQVELSPDTHMLSEGFVEPETGEFHAIYWSPLRGVFHRAILGDILVPCKAEPAQYDDSGALIREPVFDPLTDELLHYREGYVEINPYWAPEQTIRVCALDAQNVESAPACVDAPERYPFLQPFCDQYEFFGEFLQPTPGDPVSCDSAGALLAPECGCGPALERCNTQETRNTIEASMHAQQSRLLTRILDDDRPYFDLLTAPDLEINGPLAHYLRHQSRLGFDLMGTVGASTPVPDTPYVDTAWVPLLRGGRHSGVLTSIAYLLRFPTNRARAHRYYNAFECSSFIPSGPLPPPSSRDRSHSRSEASGPRVASRDRLG